VELEKVAGNTLFVIGGTVLMLGSDAKGDSTKSSSQTFESREHFISLFLNLNPNHHLLQWLL